MNGHDPLCRAFYQMHMNANICRSCDLIRAVREDQSKILHSRVMYQSGYADGEAHGRENALYDMKKYLDYMLYTELHLLGEWSMVRQIIEYADHLLCMPQSHSQAHTDVSSRTVE